jgi:hypothetical protein
MGQKGVNVVVRLRGAGATLYGRWLRGDDGRFHESWSATFDGKQVTVDAETIYSDDAVSGMFGQLGLMEQVDSGDEGQTLYEFSVTIGADLPQDDEDPETIIIERGPYSTSLAGTRDSHIGSGEIARLCAHLNTPMTPQLEGTPTVSVDGLISALAKAQPNGMTFTLVDGSVRVQREGVGGERHSATVPYHRAGQGMITPAEALRVCEELGVGVPEGLEGYDRDNVRALMRMGEAAEGMPPALAVGDLTGDTDSQSLLSVELFDSIDANYQDRGVDAQGRRVSENFDEAETEELEKEKEDPNHGD